jgi:tol-pal system protein YbgF
MRMRRYVFALTLALLAWPAAGRAQNREHLQLTADLRMLQEQVSRLQLTTNQLAEQLTATNKRLDELSDANVKQFANQKVALDQTVTLLNTLRERMQESDVRASQLTQEVTTIRDNLRALANQINALVGLLQPAQANAAPSTPSDAGGTATAPPASTAATQPSGAPADPLRPVSLQPSASEIYARAFNDYMSSNRLDLAIEGFREVIQKYPDSPEAANAQFQIGEALYQQGKYREALPEYQKLIATYKNSQHLAEAYYAQGVCYQSLNQAANAKNMFETVKRLFPGSTQAFMADQKLQNLR